MGMPPSWPAIMKQWVLYVGPKLYVTPDDGRATRRSYPSGRGRPKGSWASISGRRGTVGWTCSTTPAARPSAPDWESSTG